ncbi:MAG TPA: hypothetical protein VFH51_09090, partial [Myxococcota bacterium]|nr:hypothetical protein [Myxococcota bacterium]
TAALWGWDPEAAPRRAWDAALPWALQLPLGGPTGSPGPACHSGFAALPTLEAPLAAHLCEAIEATWAALVPDDATGRVARVIVRGREVPAVAVQQIDVAGAGSLLVHLRDGVPLLREVRARADGAEARAWLSPAGGLLGLGLLRDPGAGPRAVQLFDWRGRPIR